MDQTLKLFLLAFVLFMICEIAYLIFHFYRKKKELGWIFNDEKQEHNVFSEDELSFIKKEAAKQNSFLIDDITWNDLDLDEVYQQLNSCLCTSGDIQLYQMLRHPANEEEIMKRRTCMRKLTERPEQMQQIKTQCYRIGGQCERPLLELYDRDQHRLKIKRPLYIGLLLFNLITIGMVCLYPNYFIVVCALFYIDTLICKTMREQREYSFLSANYLYQYVRAIKALQRSNLDSWIKSNYQIDELATALDQIHISWFPDFYEADGFLLMLGKQVLFMELLSFDRLYHSLYQYRTQVEEAICVIGELEALCSMQQVMQTSNVICEAVFHEQSTIISTGMVHPLLQNPVANDVILTKNVLISGSNASGKSTYLKMIALNAIVAQAFGIAFAKSYEAGFFEIYTSMALSDSIKQKESYFMAEIRSIKRIIDRCEKGLPVLCMIDEILRGTNTGERIAAASAVLMRLYKANALCLSATHDLELTSLLSKYYQNKHFSEELDQQTMNFSYRIQEGPSNSHNATALLHNLGYDESLLEAAMKLQTTYLTHKRWMWNEEVSS